MGKGGERVVAPAASTTLKEDVDVDRVISWQEVAKHRTTQDCWMVYREKVYDVSNWHDHPGGDVIFTHGGDDFTDIFAAFHGNGAAKSLVRFQIGKVEKNASRDGGDKPAKQVAFEAGYRKLRAELIRDGMFNASLGYYAMKQLTQLALLGVVVGCVTLSDSTAVHLFGATLLGLFFQQCGWLCHDIVHHQLFANRLGGQLLGLVWGNLMQGFSCAWWRNKHNAHHAVPNLHQSVPGASDGDPDLDTMPFLAWSIKHAMNHTHTAFSKFSVSNQAFVYFPLLGIARLSWLVQSILYVAPAGIFDRIGGGLATRGVDGAEDELRPIKFQLLENIGLILHYAWYFAIVAQVPTYAGRAAFICVSNVVCGLCLALVFGLGHNGMATYEATERPDFWRLQVTTTRNIHSSYFVDWFCGGLHFQVDHHLFPTLPRHNLRAANARVQRFCKDFGVTYHSTNMWVGTKEVLSCLSGISKEFIEEFPAM